MATTPAGQYWPLIFKAAAIASLLALAVALVTLAIAFGL